jgi:hypothetical protein
LQFHRHEILLITSSDQEVPMGLEFQVLTYFKKWSALEAFKFFPRLLGQAPDIWHFVFTDSEKEKLRWGHLILAQLARALPGRVVAATFYNRALNLQAASTLPFLKTCEVVTTATRENLMYLKRKNWLSQFCETEVLPPYFLLSEESPAQDSDSDLASLAEAAHPYLVLPSGKLPEGDWTPVTKKMNLIVCGPRPEISPPGVYFVGAQLSEGALSFLIGKSSGLITAFEDLSLIELLKFHRFCSHSRTPSLAHPRQTEALPGYCIPKRNGFLIQNLAQLIRLLAENPTLEITAPLFEPLQANLADSALNELNRLYSKVRNRKARPTPWERNPAS